MAILRESAAVVNTVMDARTSLFNIGGAGRIDFYSNTTAIPVSVAAAITGQVVCTSTLNATAFGVAVDGVATANAIADSTAAAAGGPHTLDHCRIYDGAGTAIMDADCGIGAGFTVNLDDNVLISGDPVSIASFILTQAGI